MDIIRETQTRLAAAGYDIGQSKWGDRAFDGVAGAMYDAAVRRFQRDKGLDVDGIVGRNTATALGMRYEEPALAVVAPIVGGDVLPADWMPPARMTGITLHWTAGGHRANENDRAHYHVLIEHDGKLIRGIPPISANDRDRFDYGRYAAHTYLHNSGQIGVSLCCMGGDGVSEANFARVPFPLTRAQWDMAPRVLAALCRRYGIPVDRRTVLSHAEVHPTLGIAQKGKWDITRLSFDPTITGAIAIGDLFRKRTAELLAGGR